MPTPTLQTLEQQITQLPYDDRLHLIERVIRSLRTHDDDQDEYARQVAAMAADSEIQREIAAINAEFACTDMDGLE